MIRTSGIVLLSAIGILPVWAQHVAGPSLGFVFDGQAGRMRQLNGIPGAAVLGQARQDGPQLAGAAVAPDGEFAVARLADSGEAVLWTAAAGVRRLAGVDAAPSRIVLSPTGTSVAFYYAASRRVAVVTGLPASPSAPHEYSLVPLRSALGTLAVSDDGAVLLGAESRADSSGSQPAVVAIGESGGLNRMPVSAPATALAFAPNRHDAIVISPSEAFLVSDPAGTADRSSLPSGLGGATSAAFSADGTRVYLTLAGPARVAVFDTAKAAADPVVLECECSPAGLYRMGGQETYRLTDYQGNTLWILDGERNPPRIVSVPPAGTSDN
jgi:DNA-binding beta-propeller fold protein YncE